MTFAFFLLAERGHVNPFVGLAQALAGFGHRIRIYSTGDVLEQMSGAGLPFDGKLGMDSAPLRRGRAFAEAMAGSASCLFRETFLGPAPAQAAAARAVLAQERPDVAIVDPMNYGAIMAAQSERVPWFGVSTSLASALPDGFRSDVRRMADSLAGERDEIFRQWGGSPRFRAVDALSPWLNVSFALPEFVGEPPADGSARGALARAFGRRDGRRDGARDRSALRDGRRSLERWAARRGLRRLRVRAASARACPSFGFRHAWRGEFGGRSARRRSADARASGLQ